MLHTPYALFFAACPLGMALMMWLMMRGDKRQRTNDAAAGQAELSRLQAQIDQLRAGQRNRGEVPLSR